jgi:hypothetical protein
MILTHVNAQEENNNTRVYDAGDLASFTYPLDTYSVRDWFIGLPDDQMLRITYPGIITIDPNDSLIYGDEPGNVYRIRMASVVRDENVTEADLPTLLGTLPLIQYGPEALENRSVVSLTIDDLPAVRVNDLPVGQFGLTAHIIAMSDTQLFEIIVEPVVITDQADEAVQVERQKLYETIIASIHWNIDR